MAAARHFSALTLLPTLVLLGSACDGGMEAGGKSSWASQSEGASKKGDEKQDNEENEARLVRVRRLAPQAIEDRLPCTSHIEVFHEVDVLAQIRAQVVRVLVEEGQIVKKGAVLFRFDDREANLNLENAKVKEKEAENNQKTADLVVEEATNLREQAEKDLEQAERDLERDKRGVEAELTSPEALEESQLNRDRAASRLSVTKVAEARATLGQATSRTDLDAARIERKLKERLLEDYTVIAPIDGVVARLDVRGGEWISPQGKLCLIVDHDHLILYLKRPQQELGMIRAGQHVDVEVDAYPGVRFAAKINLISPTVDRSSGNFRARARIIDPELKLRPGMFCRAEIVTRVSPKALMIPKVAILYEGDKPFAYVVRDGSGHRIPIERGIETKDALEATNTSAEPGALTFSFTDSIIVVGQKNLEEGQKVVVDSEGADERKTPAEEKKPAGETTEAEGPRDGKKGGAKAQQGGGKRDSESGNGGTDK